MKSCNLLSIISVLMCALIAPTYAMNLDSLLPDERNTIEVFQKSSPKVAYVHRLSTVIEAHRKMHVPAGAGSGIIWDNKGHIVTNYHVIKGADKLTVTIGKITVPARVVGIEPRKDIAVLEIKSAKVSEFLKSFQPFELAHLHDLMVGQKAIAIGNPFGFDHSLSKGVISALGRKVPGIGGVSIHEMVQTDTPINPGNSGGPLLNSAGQLVGMNSMIFSQTGSNAGVGFAVPADYLDRTVNQIIQHGRVILSGIGIRQVDPKLARRLGIRKGILIAGVIPRTPAAKLKLHGTHRDAYGRFILGDVIVGLNAHPVENYDALYNLLTEIKVGERVTVSILRGGRTLELQLKTIDIAALR